MASRASTTEVEALYTVEFNGYRLRPETVTVVPEFNPEGENSITIKPKIGRPIYAELSVNGRKVKAWRPYEEPNAATYVWRPKELVDSLRIKVTLDTGEEACYYVRVRYPREHEELYRALMRELKKSAADLLPRLRLREVLSNLYREFSVSLRAWRTLKPIMMGIARNPRAEIVKEVVPRPVHEVDYISPDTVWAVAEAGVERVEKIPTGKAVLSYDLPENRLLKHFVNLLRVRVSRIVSEAKRVERLVCEAERPHVEVCRLTAIREVGLKVLRDIAETLRDPMFDFLQEVGELRHLMLSGAVVREDYRRLFRAYRDYVASSKPIPSVRTAPFRSPSGNPTLYELWCTLRVLEAILDLGFKPVSDNVYTLREFSYRLALHRNPVASLRRGDVRVDVYRLRSYGGPVGELGRLGSYTYEMTPTISLEVREGGYLQAIHVFDVKYTVEYNPDRFIREDVQRLHSYRDGIVEFTHDGRILRRIVGAAGLLQPTETYIKLGWVATIPLIPGRSMEELTDLLSEALP
mgnify:CR=1 FL=1